MKKRTGWILVVILGIILVALCLGIEKTKREQEEKKEEPKQVVKKEEDSGNLFAKYEEKAKKIVEKMTLEEKIGQLFLVRYDKSSTDEWTSSYPGGYILFAKDIENHTKESLLKELTSLQEKNKYPLIIGVDEEGGTVTRVSRFPAFRINRFDSPRYYYEDGGYELLEQIEKEKAQLLKSVGINLNLAPVADISTNPDDFIYERSFGHSAEETATFIENMVTYANESNINACLKHFPGYGNNEDTHTGVAIDERSYENFVENDFKPFEAGIKAKVPCILVSHNVVKSIDEDYPSSLSSKVIGELRNTLHYTGIVITDDLAMDAVSSYVENGESATLAVNAGNDMMITSDFEKMREELLESVKEGKLTEEKVNEAVQRVIAWKFYSGLMPKE